MQAQGKAAADHRNIQFEAGGAMSNHAAGFRNRYKHDRIVACQQQNVEQRRLLGDRKKRRYAIRMFMFKNVIFDYQLCRGKDRYPRFEKMTTGQKSDKNKDLENSFLDRLKTDENTALWSWKPTKELWMKQRDDRKLFQDNFDGDLERDRDQMCKWWTDRGYELREWEE